MKLSREIKTGIIVIGGILLFILGFSYLKSSPIFENSKKLYAVYQHVGGLQPGTSVSINGLNVGSVQEIRFKDKSGDLLVTLSVDNNFNFSKNSKAELYDTGIIGGKGIQIIPVFDGAVNATSGDTLVTDIRPGLTDLVQQRLTPLQQKLEGTFTNADSLLINVNEVLDKDTKRDLKQSIDGLSRLIASLQGSANTLNNILSKNEGKLESSLANFQTLTYNFAKLSDSLNNAGLGNTLAGLRTTVDRLNGVLEKIDEGDGTLGKLVNNKELYDNLNSASRELDLLLQDFRLNPKRYVNVSVFGKKQKEYELPEDDPADQIDDQ